MSKTTKILLLTVVFASFHFGSLGQGPPPPPPSSPPGPPPPPLIYSPPSASDVKEFVPAEKSFTAKFPGNPKLEEKDLGWAVTKQYKVYRRGSNSSVSITEYKEELPVSTDEAFRLIRQGILSEPRSLMDAESDFELDGIKGKEYKVNLDLRYRIIRIFIVGRRVFEIQSDVTNWHIISEDVKAAWRKETDRFFSSFKIFK